MLLLRALGWLMFGLAAPALAHSPHDEILALQISPYFVVDLTIYVIVRCNLYRTRDRGLSWQRLARGLGASHLTAVAIQPDSGQPLTLVVGDRAGNLFCSPDGGDSWIAAGTLAGEGTVEQIAVGAGAAASSFILARDRQGTVWRSRNQGKEWERSLAGVTDLCSDASNVWAGTDDGRVMRSSDGGTSWELGARLPTREQVVALATTENDDGPRCLAVGGSRGVVVVDLMHGRTTHLPLPRRGETVTSLAWGRTREGRLELYASTWRSGVFWTDPQVGKWQPRNAGLTTDPQADSRDFGVPHFRRLELSPDFAQDRFLLLAGFDGLFASSDAGRSWLEWRTVMPNSLIVGLASVSLPGAGWELAASTYGGGLWLRRRDEAAWRRPEMQFREGRLFGVAYSPNYARDGSLFVASNWSLYRSTDQGVTWSATPLSSARSGGNRGPARAWAMLRSATLGVGAMVGEVAIRRIRRRFHRWRDRLKVSLPLPGFGAVVVVSPTFVEDQTLYVQTARRLWRSEDGGRTLRVMENLPAAAICNIACSPGYSRDRTLALATATGIWLSDDAGETWRPTDCTPFGHEKISYVAFSPGETPPHLVVAVGATLSTSPDLGRSWYPMDQIDGGKVSPASIALVTGASRPPGIDWWVQTHGGGLHHRAPGQAHFSPEKIDGEFSQLADFPDRAPLVSVHPDGTVLAAEGSSVRVLIASSVVPGSWEIPTRYDAVRQEIVYSGNWRPLAPEIRRRWPRSRCTRQSGARARLCFVGSAISWVGDRGPQQGSATVYLDGVVVARVELQQPEASIGVVCFESGQLARGPHCCIIEANPRNEENRAPGQVVLHAFEVTEGA